MLGKGVGRSFPRFWAVRPSFKLETPRLVPHNRIIPSEDKKKDAPCAFEMITGREKHVTYLS